MLFGIALANPITHEETVIENRDDGFDQAVAMTSQEVAPSSQQLIVEEEEQVPEASVPEMPKVDLSQYMMLIPADQFRNFVHVPIPVPTISASVYGTASVPAPVPVSTHGSSYGSTTVVRNLSGVKGGTTIVRSESIKGLPPPPAARKTSSTIILP